MTAEEFFKGMLPKIQVTDEEIADAREKRDELAATTRKILSELGVKDIRSHAAGALAAGTQIKPLNDVDLVVYGSRESLPEAWRETPSQALREICAGLGAATGYTCEPRAHAVKVEFPDVQFSADVVFGVQRSPSGLYIPHCPKDGEHDWIVTDPKRHAELVRQRNRETGYRFARVVRILKSLNAYWGTQDAQVGEGKKPLSSFHLTALAWTIASDIATLTSGVDLVLTKAADLVLHPLPDPSGVGDPIEARDPALAQRKLQTASGRVKAAIAAGEGAEAILVEVFGDLEVIGAILAGEPMSITTSGKLKSRSAAGTSAVALPSTTSFGDSA